MPSSWMQPKVAVLLHMHVQSKPEHSSTREIEKTKRGNISEPDNRQQSENDREGEVHVQLQTFPRQQVERVGDVKVIVLH